MRSIKRVIATAALALGGALALASQAGAATSWELSLAASSSTILGEPLQAVATLRAPDTCARMKRGWGCLQGSSGVAGPASSGSDARAQVCVAAGPTAPRCQGWGDTGVEFSLYGPDDATCAGRPVLHRWVALTAAVAGSYASGTFVPELAGVYRWTVAVADADNSAAPIGCAAAVAVTVGEQPVDPPVDPDPSVDPHPPVDPPRTDPPSGAAPAPVVPGLAAPAPTAPASPATIPEPPAIERLALAARCVRPTAAGRVAVTIGLKATRNGPVQVRVERALGTRGRDRCPSAGGRGRFDGRFRTVATVRREVGAAGTAAHAAAFTRRLTLDLQLEPALYRITVRAALPGGKLSSPKRRFLRVLAPR